MEITGNQAFQMGLSFRYNFWHDHFLSAKGRILSINFDPDKSYKENQMYSGWQLTYSYYSKIGPISVSMAEAYPKKVLVLDFSLGFWF